jgi:hypothetical protein
MGTRSGRAQGAKKYNTWLLQLQNKLGTGTGTNTTNQRLFRVEDVQGRKRLFERMDFIRNNWREVPLPIMSTEQIKAYVERRMKFWNRKAKNP